MTRTHAIQLIGAALIAFVASPIPAFAGDRRDHRERDTTEHRMHDTTAARRNAYAFDRAGDRRVIRQYYYNNALPPVYARRALTPHEIRELRERREFPPAYAGRTVVVPGPLNYRLAPQSRYYSRYFAGRNLVVVDRRTNRIVEVIPNALPR